MGRRKIEMTKVEDSATRQVTFSKRRNGIFKKANELATLCAAAVAVVVFSPGGRPYSYGSPSVRAVTERFLGPHGTSEDQPENSNASRASRRESRQRAKIDGQQAQLDWLMKELEAAKRRGHELEEILKETCGVNKSKDLNDLHLDELKDYKKKLEGLHEEIMNKARDMEVSSTLMMLSKDETPFAPEGCKAKKKSTRSEKI